MIVVVLL